MILSDFTLRQHHEHIVSPFVLRSVHARSGLIYGLSACGYDIRIRRGALMWPGRFLLASTLERFEMPDDVAAVVHDKSTLARLGVCVQNTFIEPGWCGFLTVEITNHSGWFRRLHDGQPIAQVVFHRLDRPAERPYRGKYQDQPDRPVRALFEKA